MDRVFTSERPRLGISGALDAASACFGVRASLARDLGSERDQTFALDGADGKAVAVMKVSNPSEEPDVLDMEAEAAIHVTGVDPGLGVALPWRTLAAGDPGPARPDDRPADLRARWTDGEAAHWVRVYDALPGHSGHRVVGLDDAAIIAWGETTARLGQALRSFSHARAQRKMLWDVQHALAARGMAGDVRDRGQRRLVVSALDRFEQVVKPQWPLLRAQVIHTDLTLDNTLTDDDGLITGIVDFGDMSFTALITDLASVLDSLGSSREGSEMFRLARLVLDGYQRRIELEELELSLLGVMWAARSAMMIAVSSWRVAQGLEEPAFAERYNAGSARIIATMEQAGWDEVTRELGARPSRTQTTTQLANRRRSVFGPAAEPLFYDVPVQVESAAGVWITESGGRRLLDAYNNVPCVGHGHPRVTTAISRQIRAINTHTRYLHPTAIELAERLVGLVPPPLDTVILVNSGSEANDLAWRMATAATGRRGALCTSLAYHGVTEATAALSPERWADGAAPTHVETWEPPDGYRGTDLTTDGFAAAIERLGTRGLSPAAAILDCLLTDERLADLDPAYVSELVRLTHEAGGLWIADEVQAGHGRTGEAMWGFERLGVVPDFVTLGKPMGNGHPVGAVITRSDIAASIARQTSLFSTFGGNPVSAAAALAVLDVIEDERVLARVRDAGQTLGAALDQVAQRHEIVGDVRGVGLAWGVELVSDPATRSPDGDPATRSPDGDPATRSPDGDLACAVRDRLRHRGVLVGTTGRHGNILKIRPPLAFTREHVPVLADALDAVLTDTAPA